MHQDGPSQKLDGSFPTMGWEQRGPKRQTPGSAGCCGGLLFIGVLAVFCHTWATEQVSELPESSPTVLLVS